MDAEPVTALRPDGRRPAIHPIDVRGRFITWRRIVFAALVAVYVGAPLLKIDGRPALYLDVDGRRFFLFGGTFNAQDLWLLLFLTAAVLFGLLFVTAWHGRLWCGWACPQTVFLEGVFRPIERLFEGSRARRLKLPGQPWTVPRVLRTTGKHAAYVVVALIVAHTALVPFVSPAAFSAMLRDGPAAHPLAFSWAMAITGALYFNYAWFREQLCIVLCPYGRLQSALHDENSIIIAYDGARGEPRGPLRRALPVMTEPRTGDCIDCRKCVHACPTAIDIRAGFQMECIACAQCIDVCDEVMDKIARPRGLIRMTSLAELEGKRRRVGRARLYVYGALTATAVIGLVLGLAGRTPFEANLTRPPGVPWVLDGKTVRNTFDVHLVNKGPRPSRLFLSIEAAAPVDVRFGAAVVALRSLEHARVPLVVVADEARARTSLTLVVRDEASGVVRKTAVPFAAPP